MFRIDTVNKEFIETKDLSNPFEFDLNNIDNGREELWTSKCRLVPVKEISVPRLELLACLLLSKLIASVNTAVESEVQIECFVERICKLYCCGYGKCIQSGRFGCRTGSRKFGIMLTVKTGFMHQLH